MMMNLSRKSGGRERGKEERERGEVSEAHALCRLLEEREAGLTVGFLKLCSFVVHRLIL